MKKLSNTEAELKNSVAYEKRGIFILKIKISNEIFFLNAGCNNNVHMQKK